MKKLENEIVQLIPMELEHVEGIYGAAQDKKIWEHMSVDLIDKSCVLQYVQDAIQRRENGTDHA